MSLLRRLIGSKKNRAQRVRSTHRNLLGQAFESLEDRKMMAAFSLGDIAVFEADSSSANNTTFTIVGLNTTSADQTFAGSNTIPIGVVGGSSLRTSGSATSTGYLATTNDGSLLSFDAHNSTSTGVNANTLIPRGVGTLNTGGSFNLAATYTGTSGNQARGATSLNNSNWFIADQGGIYTNGTTSASPAANVRGIKAFGGTVYTLQQSNSASTIVVNTVSAPSGGTINGLPGLANNNTAVDFALISSGENGATFDVLYVTTTAGISKFSLVSGSWVANSSATISGGLFGIAATKDGVGADLYVSTGGGALAGNSVLKYVDGASWNSSISLDTPTTLYTAPAGTTVKGVSLAPDFAPTDISISNSTVAAGAASGTTVGVLSTTDSSAGDSFTYSFTGSGNDNTSFQIAGNLLKTSGTPAAGTYLVHVRSTDQGHLFKEKDISITVTSPPTALHLSRSDVDEDLPSAHLVGTFTTDDADTGDTFAYTLVSGIGDDDNASFSIGGAEGDQLLTGAGFDHETKSSYFVLVRTTDSTANSFDQAFTITINDVNEAPVFTSPNAFHVNENLTAVGTLAANDPDGDSLTYSLKDGTDAQFFSVNLTSGALTFKAPPNFENPRDAGHDNTYSFRVKVTDGARTTIQNLSVVVDNVVEQPVLTLASSAPDYTLDQTSFRLDTSASLSAPDSGNFNGGVLTVKITSGADVSNRLFVGGALTRSGADISKSGVGVVATYTGGPGTNDLVITFNSNASAAIVREMVRAIAFKTYSSYLVVPRTVSFDLTDGIGGAIDTKTTTFSTVAPNADIVLGLPTSSVGYTQNGASAIVAADLTLTAYSTTSFNGGVLTVKVTDGISNANRLFVGGSFVRSGTDITLSGVLVATYNNNGGVGTNDLVITFTSNATKDIVKQLARSIAFKTYNGTGITPPDRSVSFQLTDSLNNISNEVVKTINVSP